MSAGSDIEGLDATSVAGWSHASDTTKIDGGDIYTNTVTATQINVSQLSAISADLGTITAGTITGGTIQTAAANARVVLGTTGIKWYDATTQRGQILNDGSGWLGNSSHFSWTTAGVLTINADKITAGTLTGRTVQTAAAGQRFVVSTPDNRAYFYDASNNELIRFGEDIQVGVDGMMLSNNARLYAYTDANNWLELDSGGINMELQGSSPFRVASTNVANNDTTAIWGIYDTSATSAFGRNRMACYGIANIANVGNNDSPVGVYGKAVTTGSGIPYAGKFEDGKVYIKNECEIDGAFNHDGTTVGFFGTAPATKQTHIIDADGSLADITTKFNNLLLKLETYGLLATS